jgi:hypothetical protein
MPLRVGVPTALANIPAAASQSPYPPYDGDEAESILRRSMKGLASGMGWVGSVMDKTFGGRAVRQAIDTVVTGDPSNSRDLLSILPFSDTLGITDYKNQVSGEKIWRDATGRDASRGAWLERNLVGPAIEIATDPGTLLNPLGLTAKGTAAAKAGKLTPGLGKSIAAGERSLFRVGVPFATEKMGFDLGTGEFAEKIGTKLDRAGTAIRNTAPVRSIFANFNPESRGALTYIGQKAAEDAYYPTYEARFADFARDVYDLQKELEPHIQAARSAKLAPEQIDKALRLQDRIGYLASESEPAARKILPGARNWKSFVADLPPELADPDVLALLGPQYRAIRNVGLRAGRKQRAFLPDDLATGIARRELKDPFAAYTMAQQQSGPIYQTQEWGRKRPNTTANASTVKRQAEFRNVPGGRVQINDLLRDPRLSGKTLDPDAAKIILGSLTKDERSVNKIRQQFVGEINDYIQNDIKKRARVAATAQTAFDPVAAEAAARLAAAKKYGYTVPLGGVFDDAAIAGVADGLKDNFFASTAGKLGKYIGKHGKDYAEQGVDFFKLDPIGSLLARGERWARGQAGAESLYNLVGKSARLTDQVEGLPKGARTLDDVLTSNFARLANTETGVWRSVDELGKSLGRNTDQLFGDYLARHPQTSIDELVDDAGQWTSSAGRALLKDAHLPADVTKDAVNWVKGWLQPHEIGPGAQLLNSANNLFRSLVYPLFPASHVRNLGSGGYNNLLEGVGPTAYGSVTKAMSGQAIDDPALLEGLSRVAGRSLTGDEARDLLLKEAYANRVLAGVRSREVAGGIREVGEGSTFVGAPRKLNLAQDLAWFLRPEFRQAITDPKNWRSLKESLLAPAQGDNLAQRVVNKVTNALPPGANPFKVAGVGGLDQDYFLPVKLAREGAVNLEDRMRLALFGDQIAKGAAPDVASKMVHARHFDYGKLTDTERYWMRSLMPFYTFSRKNLPMQLGMAAQTPHKLSIPLRALSPRGDGYVPQYLAGGVAIPFGENSDGTQRYLSQTGLPMEEAFERFVFNPGGFDPLATAQRFMGMLTPYAKGPLEAATNRQFFTGRELSDLRPSRAGTLFGALNPDENPGQTRLAQMLTQVISNTPLTRMASTLDRLTDSRKELPLRLLNIGTGLRISDVDMERARNIDARNFFEQQLGLAPNVREATTYYVRPEDRAKISPEQAEQLRIYYTLMKAAKDAAKAKRQAAENQRVGVRM